MIAAAGVDVKVLAQKGAANGRTFYVPAREALAPGRRPAHGVAGKAADGSKPEGKVSRMFFGIFCDHFLARARKHVRKFLAGQGFIFWKFGDIEINCLVRFVGKTFVQKLLYERDYFWDMAGGRF